MKCDLCNHRELQSTNNLLCESCGEMIQRLVTVQNRMDSHEPRNPDANAAAAAAAPRWGLWQ
jgi:hypothetical protein